MINKLVLFFLVLSLPSVTFSADQTNGRENGERPEDKPMVMSRNTGVNDSEALRSVLNFIKNDFIVLLRYDHLLVNIGGFCEINGQALEKMTDDQTFALPEAIRPDFIERISGLLENSVKHNCILTNKAEVVRGFQSIYDGTLGGLHGTNPNNR